MEYCHIRIELSFAPFERAKNGNAFGNGLTPSSFDPHQSPKVERSHQPIQDGFTRNGVVCLSNASFNFCKATGGSLTPQSLPSIKSLAGSFYRFLFFFFYILQANYWAANSKGPNSYWKSKYYTGSSLFSPKEVCEEIFLLLLLSEAMAVRDAVLSQSPDFRELRKASMRNATVVYDLLIVCCIQHGQTAMLCESLERALKFSFEDAHIWSQFAYSLIAAGKFNKAVLVLKEVARLCPDNPLPCLMAAKVCLEHLSLVDEGFNLAVDAVQRAEAQHSNVTSR